MRQDKQGCWVRRFRTRVHSQVFFRRQRNVSHKHHVTVTQQRFTRAHFSTCSPTALKRPDKSKHCHCLLFAKCIASLLHHFRSLRPLGCDSTIVLAVVRHSAPATTTTHSRVIRLRGVLTGHRLQWTYYRSHKCDDLSYVLLKASSFLSVTNYTEAT